MLSGNVLAALCGCASSCVSQFKSKRSKVNERISVWCFLGSDAAIYWVPVPGGRGIISLWIPRAVSGWRKKQIEECEMSLKQMQILDGAVAVKPEPVGVVGTDLGGTHLMYGSQYVGKTPDKKTAIFFKDVPIGAPLYTTPPQRKPLTDEEIILIVAECAASHQHTDIHFARAIERAHGIKELV